MKPLPLLSLYRERVPWKAPWCGWEGARRAWWWNMLPQLRNKLDILRRLPLVLVQGQGEYRWSWVQKAETLASFRKMNTPPSEERCVSKKYLWRVTKARRSVREEISPVLAVPLVYRGKDTGDDEPDVERLLLSWNLDESQKVETSVDELGPLSPLAAKKHLVAFPPDVWWNFGKVLSQWTWEISFQVWYL